MSTPRPRTGLAEALLLAVLVACGLSRCQPPDLPESTEGFDVRRAWRDVTEIARDPHPTGSTDNTRVREYLKRRLTDLGLRPTVQTATVRSGRWIADGAELHNLVARVPGTASTGVLLLVAHYDSVPYGPGAGDDAAGVAVVLETLRHALAAPLRNDLMVLLSDGEEGGLLGARAFARDHPWGRDATVMLNVEGRGNRGPSVMFETSPENGWLIRALAEVAPHPVANSLAGDVYRLMPNSTDFTALRETGATGLNFAYIGGLEHYHAATDTPDNLDPRSVYHHGSTLVPLALRLGNADLSEVRAPDRVYFDLPGDVLVHYPARWGLPLACACLASVLAALWYARARRALGGRELARGLAVQLAVLALLPGLTWGLWWTLARLKVDPDGWFNQRIHTDRALTWGLAFGALAAQTALIRLVHSRWRIRPAALAGAAALVWAALAVATPIVLPGGSWLLTWPLAGFACTWPVIIAAGDDAQWLPGRLALVVGAAPAVILIAPLVALLTDALTHRAAFVTMAVLVLAAGLLTPLIHRMTAPLPRRYAVCFGLAALCWIGLTALR